jgi:hypothetical protein
MNERRQPGAIRDAIVSVFQQERRELTLAELRGAVTAALGGDVSASSIRSYLNLNTPGQFIRTGRGKYRLVRR